METKEVILKYNANIFGFQLKKDSKIYINPLLGDKDASLLECETDEDGKKLVQPLISSSSLFDKSPEDFIKEAERVNDLYDEIEKEGGQLPLYEFFIINDNKEKPKLVTLFGMNHYLLAPNFGSDKDVSIVPLREDLNYLEYLNQSAHHPFNVDLLKLESDNSKQITQIITITSKDANGQLCQNLLITQIYIKQNQDDVKKVDVSHPMIIDGNTNLQFNILPDTKLKVKIYGKTNTFLSNETLNILNALLSCQIQQGSDFVSIENIKKFCGAIYNHGFYNSVDFTLKNLFEKGFIDFKDGLYGYKFKTLKVDGSTEKDLSLTKVLQRSEYNLIDTN